MSYLTRQSVREEAGFQEVETEALIGVTNGSNKVFATNRRPLVDMNDDDSMTEDDVIVFDDGIPVAIDDFDPATGSITLVAAPGNNSEMTAMYASSALPDSYIDKLIVEAEAIVNGSLKKFTVVPLSEEDTLNYARARRIALFYASGFALIRDYGKNTDDSESAKDGYAKLKEAKSMLEQLMSDIKDNSSSSGSGGNVSVVSEGHIFEKDNCDTRSHNYFMRKEC